MLDRMTGHDRRGAVVRAARRVGELNFARDDEFQDSAMSEIRLALDAFRATVDAEVPPPGTDPLLDALMDLTRELDASPEAVTEAAARLLEIAGEPESQEIPTT